MSGTVINLRQARKAKARTEKERQADENRRLHGRTNAQKKVDVKTKNDATRHLDGHKREDT